MKNELESRTKAFALHIIKFVSNLPKNKTTDVLGYQLLKSGTSIGANYREARRAESTDDFIHKIAIVEKEANESKYWLELLMKQISANNVNGYRFCGKQLNCWPFLPVLERPQKQIAQEEQRETLSSRCRT